MFELLPGNGASLLPFLSIECMHSLSLTSRENHEILSKLIYPEFVKRFKAQFPHFLHLEILADTWAVSGLAILQVWLGVKWDIQFELFLYAFEDLERTICNVRLDIAKYTLRDIVNGNQNQRGYQITGTLEDNTMGYYAIMGDKRCTMFSLVVFQNPFRNPGRSIGDMLHFVYRIDSLASYWDGRKLVMSQLNQIKERRLEYDDINWSTVEDLRAKGFQMIYKH